MRYGYYVYLADLPDATRIFGGRTIWAVSDVQLAFVMDEFRRCLSVNPDVKILPERFIVGGPFDHPEEQRKCIEEWEAKLKESDPDRQSVRDLIRSGTIDTGERLLHDPQISRLLAGHKASKAS